MLLQMFDLAPFINGVGTLFGSAFIGLVGWYFIEQNNRLKRIERKVDTISGSVIRNEERINAVDERVDSIHEELPRLRKT